LDGPAATSPRPAVPVQNDVHTGDKNLLRYRPDHFTRIGCPLAIFGGLEAEARVHTHHPLVQGEANAAATAAELASKSGLARAGEAIEEMHASDSHTENPRRCDPGRTILPQVAHLDMPAKRCSFSGEASVEVYAQGMSSDLDQVRELHLLAV